MATQTSAGTTIGISATLPTTFDTAPITGYPSLTLTSIGEVTDIPAVGGARSVITHSPLAEIDVDKFLGSFDHGSVSLTMALDDADAGQVILNAAVTSGAKHAIGITLPDGTQKFKTGIVSAVTFGVGTVDGTVVQATAQFEFTKSTVTKLPA